MCMLEFLASNKVYSYHVSSFSIYENNFPWHLYFTLLPGSPLSLPSASPSPASLLRRPRLCSRPEGPGHSTQHLMKIKKNFNIVQHIQRITHRSAARLTRPDSRLKHQEVGFRNFERSEVCLKSIVSSADNKVLIFLLYFFSLKVNSDLPETET